MATPKIFQSGQKLLTTLSGLFLWGLDNGGPVNTVVNMTAGTFVLDGVTPVVVADDAVTATSRIIITLQTVGGTVGAIPVVQTKTAGTGFTVLGTASDSSTYGYLIIG